MLGGLLEFLECPHCCGALRLDDGTVRCETGHAFDVARQGYVSLLTGAATPTGDTAPMVAARTAFLDGGHYRPIVEAVCDAAERVLVHGPAGCVLDLGAGTGHHLAAVLDRAPQRSGIALDASKYAARRAARAHPRMGAVVCDVWRRLPVGTGAAALVLDVFAPRNPAQIRRVLCAEGALLVVTPTAGHLAELVATADLLTVDDGKQQRLGEQFGAPACSTRCEYPMSLPHADMEALAQMGPSAWHTAPAALHERIRALPDPMPVTASVTISVYRTS